jgi:hypothetical protein
MDKLKDAEKRDAVLRRMLATPKGKPEKAPHAELTPSTSAFDAVAMGSRDTLEEVPEPLRLIMDENAAALASLPR